MTYQEYFLQAEFETVWAHLNGLYKESKDSKPLYEAVFNEVKAMPVDSTLSTDYIEVVVSQDNVVRVKGAPDPQEWLVGREVNIEYYDDSNIPFSVNSMTAHLIYWSTLYGIKTRKMQKEEFRKWRDNCMKGPFYILPDNDLYKFDEAIMLKYVFLDFDGVLNTT